MNCLKIVWYMQICAYREFLLEFEVSDVGTIMLVFNQERCSSIVIKEVSLIVFNFLAEFLALGFL